MNVKYKFLESPYNVWILSNKKGNPSSTNCPCWEGVYHNKYDIDSYRYC